VVHPKILIYGYGNPGRQDDGLGNAFVDRMEQWAQENEIEGIAFDSNYQLNIEDAAEIAEYDLVIFADASTEEIDDFILTPVDASTQVTFTTHAASPGYIVDLCKQIYKRTPAAFLMHIRGYEWSFKEGLSPSAVANLHRAVEHTVEALKDPKTLIESYQEF
jgi:hydrogenase maturation protease